MMPKEDFEKMSSMISSGLFGFFNKLLPKLAKKVGNKMEPKELMVNIGTNFVYALDAIGRRGASEDKNMGRDAGRFSGECILWGVATACTGMGMDIETILENIAKKMNENGPKLREEYQAGIKK